MISTAPAIEAYFQAVHQRMADLPVVNPALRVELLGWQAIAEHDWLGVLITPWCMNLFWQSAAHQHALKGDTRLLSLPSGDYECLLHQAEGLGTYATASLCSPMQDFNAQDEAQQLAEQILDLLLAEPTRTPTAGVSRRGLFQRLLGQEAEV